MTNEYYGAHTDLVPGTKARSGDINTMDQAIVEAFDKLPSARSMKTGTMNYAVNSSATVNAYTVTLDSSITSYADGMEVKLRPVRDNTGPATLNVNGIGNVVIRRQDGASVQAGDILAQGPLSVIYNGSTNAFIIGPTGNAHVVAAATSASAAAQSAGNAATSAGTASSQANTATIARQDAQTAASTATNKATEAANSASGAASSATAADISATNAATSASSANTAAITLAAAVTSATGSAGTATTKASEASASASAASTAAATATQKATDAQGYAQTARDWAVSDIPLAGGLKSALKYADDARQSAVTASNAAAGAVAGQVNADWNATSGAAQIMNKPAIPTLTSQLPNDSGYITQAGARAAISVTGSLSYNSTTGAISYTAPALATVATSGSYADLSAKPVIPDSASITSTARAAISVSGSLAYNSTTGVLSATIPTTTSQLTNNSGFITSAGAPVQSVAGRTGAVTLAKADVALGNVDNTADTAKPVSAAQQTALDLKANKANDTLVKPTFKDYIEQFQALAPGAAVTVDTTNGTLIKITTTVASTAITLPARVAGRSYTIVIKWGAAGHTATFSGGGLVWAGGSVPAATSVAGKRDKYVYTCDDEVTMGQDGGRNF